MKIDQTKKEKIEYCNNKECSRRHCLCHYSRKPIIEPANFYEPVKGKCNHYISMIYWRKYSRRDSIRSS